MAVRVERLTAGQIARAPQWVRRWLATGRILREPNGEVRRLAIERIARSPVRRRHSPTWSV